MTMSQPPSSIYAPSASVQKQSLYGREYSLRQGSTSPTPGNAERMTTRSRTSDLTKPAKTTSYAGGMVTVRETDDEDEPIAPVLIKRRRRRRLPLMTA